MKKYVKVKGHNNWFLVYKSGDNDKELSQVMQEKLLRSEVSALHNKNVKPDYKNRLIKIAIYNLNYEDIVEKYGTILIRPIGSYMPLEGNEIIKEKFDTNFPIDNYADIVICENDRIAEHKWVEYLKNRFPNDKITTINYFDLRSDEEIKKYFEKAKFVTFSTTFSDLEWFKKLSNNVSANNKIIGYSHNKNMWEEVLEINPSVEVVSLI